MQVRQLVSFFCLWGALFSRIRYSQRQTWSLIFCLDGALEVLISAELLHKSYSLVARTLCCDSHKSRWRRSLPNTCAVDWFNYPPCRVDLPSVLLVAHLQGHLKRARLLGWETDVRLCLLSQLLIMSPHLFWAAGEKSLLETLQNVYLTISNVPWCRGSGWCVWLLYRYGRVWCLLLRVPLVLSRYQGKGQLQHDALQGPVVLKAEVCLATGPIY